VTRNRRDDRSISRTPSLYEQVRREHDHIDILFANAGGGEFAPLGAISEEHFDKTFDINVKGIVFTVQKALLLLRDGGSIILTGSTAGTVGSPMFSVYGATKAALRSFARNWMLDLKDRHIRINTLSPGPIRTPGLHGLGKTEEESRALFAQLAASVPMGRLGNPTRWLRPRCSSPRTRAASSMASSSSSTVAWRRFESPERVSKDSKRGTQGVERPPISGKRS
jgi:NAD(P)-dependent dehydrogenase (short-subunit alcohol dehydrogenase family)